MKFTALATVRLAQNVSCNVYTQPKYQQLATSVIILQAVKAAEEIG